MPPTSTGEEFLYVLDGTIELSHGEEVYVLNAGDSVYWDSNEPHSLKALGDKIAHGIAVLYTRN